MSRYVVRIRSSSHMLPVLSCPIWHLIPLSHKDFAKEDNFEAYARVNVGLSLAIGTTIIMLPIDMRGRSAQSETTS